MARLKSGDPMVFGRAGEEIAALRKAGIGYQIVPGVSAALAAAADTATPVTLRKVSSGFVMATAHGADDSDLHHWAALGAVRADAGALHGQVDCAAKSPARLIGQGASGSAAGRHRRQCRPRRQVALSRHAGRAGGGRGRHGRWAGNHFRRRGRCGGGLGGRRRDRRARLQGGMSMEILAGNELTSGATVYLDRKGSWVEDLQAARVFGKDEAEARDAAIAATKTTVPHRQPRNRRRSTLVDGQDRARPPARAHPRRGPDDALQRRCSTASIWMRTVMYRYDEFDAAFVQEPHRAVCRPGARGACRAS